MIKLSPQQAEAVKTVNGPVLLLAVPGSGKTTVLVLRLGYMIKKYGIDPENILTVTYTVAATRDMACRFAGFYGEELASRMEFRTINGICAKVISYYSRALGKKAFSLVTDEKQTAGILSQIYQQVEQTWPTEAELRSVRTMITYIKNQMLTEEEIRTLGSGSGAGQRENGIGSSASGPLRESDSHIDIARIYERYNRWLREQHLMDYDDQMVYALTILRKVPQVLSHFQDQYRYICVDEAQDTSKIQHAIIALLASREDNLFMVGDEDQSIYGFRAAYPEALLNFEKENRGAKILLMEQNYRSGEGIVQAADRFIQQNTLRHAKHMISAAGGTEEAVREIYLRGRRAQYTYLRKVAESCAQRTSLQQADAVQADGQQILAQQTAVLYRNNESAIPLVDLLEREGIPYRIRNAEVGFFTHRTVMDITNIIRLAYDPFNVDAFWTVYYKLGMYLSKEKAALICDLSLQKQIPVLDAAIRYAKLGPQVTGNVKSVRTHLMHLKEERGDQAVTRIVRYMGYGDYLSGAGIKDSKVYILTTIGARTETPAELLERLAFLEDIFRNKEQDPSGPVILSTIHASKGLEYDTVYLMDVLDGTFPETVPASRKYMSMEERRVFEEERRLFYVGMTRAKSRLCVFTTDANSVLADELFGAGSQKNKEAARKIAEQRQAALAKSTSKSTGGKKRQAYAGTSAEVGGAADPSWKSAGQMEDFVRTLRPGKKIVHAAYGEGVVVSREAGRVRIRFADRERVMSVRTLLAKKLLM